jgi:hypothetical protein
MANLLKPINRCLLALKQANSTRVLAMAQQRFKSDNKPTNKDSLNNPIEKKPFDETADPKESCMINKNKLKKFFASFY